MRSAACNLLAHVIACAQREERCVGIQEVGDVVAHNLEGEGAGHAGGQAL